MNTTCFTESELIEELEEKNIKYCLYENKCKTWIFTKDTIFFNFEKDSLYYKKHDLHTKGDINIKRIGKDFNIIISGPHVFYNCVFENNVIEPYLLTVSKDNKISSCGIDFRAFAFFITRQIFNGIKVERIK